MGKNCLIFLAMYFSPKEMNIASGILKGKKNAKERWQKEKKSHANGFFTVSNFAIIEKINFES